MQEQVPQIWLFVFVDLDRQPHESKGDDDEDVPTGLAVFLFPFSPRLLWTMSHEELPLLRTHTHSLAEMWQEEKQEQKRGIGRRNEWVVSYVTGALPQLPLSQYINLLQDTHSRSETLFVSVQDAT